MPRFFVKTEEVSPSSFTLSGADAHHISFALRMAVGDPITVCDACGRVFACTLAEMDGVTVRADVVKECTSEGESPVEITVYQAYPKGDKLELIIQKSVELGAVAIVPFESARCMKRPKQDKIEEQTKRLNRIAEEAGKQCGRSRLPKVHLPLSFARAVEEACQAELALFCYEGCTDRTLTRVLQEQASLPKRVSLIIGCEGGFSPEEAEAIRRAGATEISLGTRILRCETASLFALSAISVLWELA